MYYSVSLLILLYLLSIVCVCVCVQTSDLTSLSGSEEDKLKAMMQQAAEGYTAEEYELYIHLLQHYTICVHFITVCVCVCVLRVCVL